MAEVESAEIVRVAWLHAHAKQVWSPIFRRIPTRRKTPTPAETVLYSTLAARAGTHDPVSVRYEAIDARSNISLSVHPTLKQQWGVTHELFGNPWNTHGPYCTLFPDLEAPRGNCNAYTFVPSVGDVVLVNPPYTAAHIEATCTRIMQVLRHVKRLTCIFVLPVWDAASRKKLGLRAAPDMPAITRLLASPLLVQAYLGALPFYDGWKRRRVQLRDPVHVIVLRSGA